MTNAALLAPPSWGNVEVAWILDERWADARRLLRAIASKGRAIDDAEFVEPSMDRVTAWMPLRRATYDPLHRALRVEWKDAADARRTDLRYAERSVSLDNGTLAQSFALVDGISWLVTRKHGGGAVDGCCPIDIPVELLPACVQIGTDRTPEEWLRMLGAVLAKGEDDSGRNGVSPGEVEPNQGKTFEWSERVRDLAARMRYIEKTFCDKTLNPVEEQWQLRLFQRIFDSHDPAVIVNAHEQVWRVWVRLELWLVARNLSTSTASRRDRASWRERARRLRRGLGIATVPSALRPQLRAAAKAMGEPT